MEEKKKENNKQIFMFRPSKPQIPFSFKTVGLYEQILTRTQDKKLFFKVSYFTFMV
jgi:hypothetical protein